ncbi:MAG: type II toxin-antitoxin system PemK/MazF family toxin [Acidobacteriota bacterium]
MGRRGGVASRIARGDVRLYRFAPPDKERPVVILTRDTAIRHLTRVTVAPITSTLRDVPSEVALGVDDGMKQLCAVNLHNVVTVAQQNVGRRVAQLSPQKMSAICAAWRFAVGCD